MSNRMMGCSLENHSLYFSAVRRFLLSSQAAGHLTEIATGFYTSNANAIWLLFNPPHQVAEHSADQNPPLPWTFATEDPSAKSALELQSNLLCHLWLKHSVFVHLDLTGCAEVALPVYQ